MIRTFGICKILQVGVILLTAVIGCASGPKVSHSSVSGEVRSVENWKIIWSDSLAWLPASEDSDLMDIKPDNQEAARYCRDYIGKIEHTLRTKYGFQFYDNMPVSGYLMVSLWPRVYLRSMTVPDRRAEARWRPTSKHPSHSTGTLATGAYGLALGIFSLLGSEDRPICQVNVHVLDATNRPFADAEVTKGGSSSIKPDEVAEIVNRLITTGQGKE